jgi:hypothetical protein
MKTENWRAMTQSGGVTETIGLPALTPLQPTSLPTLTQIGLIPGLERLVPGTHDPRYPVRSRFGTFKLPVRFHGRDVALIADGALLGL